MKAGYEWRIGRRRCARCFECYGKMPKSLPNEVPLCLFGAQGMDSRWILWYFMEISRGFVWIQVRWGPSSRNLEMSES